MNTDCLPSLVIMSSLFDLPLLGVSPTVSILNFTFLGTLLGDTALPLDDGAAGRSLDVLISVSLSNVSCLATVLSAVCLNSGWPLLVGRVVELVLLFVGVVCCCCRQSITAVSATRWSCSSKSCACCGIALVLAWTDGLVVALPEWSSLSNTEWWASTGSLLPIKVWFEMWYRGQSYKYVILFRDCSASWIISVGWWRLPACVWWVSVNTSLEPLYKYTISSCIMLNMKHHKYLATDGVLSSFLISFRRRGGTGIHGNTLLFCYILPPLTQSYTTTELRWAP